MALNKDNCLCSFHGCLHQLGSRRGLISLEYVRLRIKRSGFEPWLGTMRCVLGQDTPLTVPRQYLSPPRGGATHPGGSRNTPSCFMLKKLEYAPACREGPLGLYICRRLIFLTKVIMTIYNAKANITSSIKLHNFSFTFYLEQDKISIAL